MRKTALTLTLGLGSLLLCPSAALAQCNGLCEVGGAGTGGVSSDGKAQGFHYIVPGHNPGSTATNSGNLYAGRLVIDRFGTVVGTLSGTCRDDLVRGAGTGIFGDWEGLFDEIVEC